MQKKDTMKSIKYFFHAAFAAMGCAVILSCGTFKTQVVSAVSVPEEGNTMFTRVTPEGASVLQNLTKKVSYLAIDQKNGRLAYLSGNQKEQNIHVISIYNPNISSQRTHRNDVYGGFSFSPDGEKLLFNTSTTIFETNAREGALATQVATGDWPVYSYDGKYIFFQKTESNTQYVWRYDIKSKSLSTLCLGSTVSPSHTPNEIYVLRQSKNNERQFYEIVKVNYESGTESIIFSNSQIDPCAVSESPDGRWLAFSGYAYEEKKGWGKRQLFVVSTDGTGLVQLTYHPGASSSPVWSDDGTALYFISGRGSSNYTNGIWKMNVNLGH